jgi:hypothetical protein
MTARRAFGTTAAWIVVGSPVAVLCIVAAIYIHERRETRKYAVNGNAPTTWPECDDTAELLIPEEWWR